MAAMHQGRGVLDAGQVVSTFSRSDERRRQHWCLCQFEGLSANAAGRITGHSRSAVISDLKHVRAGLESVPAEPATTGRVAA